MSSHTGPQGGSSFRTGTVRRGPSHAAKTPVGAAGYALLQQAAGPEKAFAMTASGANHNVGAITRKLKSGSQTRLPKTAVTLQGSDVRRIKELLSQPAPKVEQRCQPMDAAETAAKNEEKLRKAMSNVDTVAKTLGRENQQKSPDAVYRKQKMKRLERLRHAEAAQDAARKEGELSRADLEEQKRMEQEEKANPALKRAREKDMEKLEEIKKMNEQMHLAEIIEGRQRQIEEKEKSKREEEQEEKTFYCMQLEDQRQLLEENEREQQRQKERTKQFRSEIQKQLDNNAYRKAMEEEEKEMEGQLQQAMWQEQQQKEQEQRQKRLEEARKQREELNKANQRFIEMHKEKKREEELREKEALRWMIKKERDEAEIASQKEQERKRKEELQKKMLAEQERVMDARHEEDEKKAKQHQEQRILQERAENERRKREKEELRQRVMAERERQLRAKAAMKKEQEQIDKAQVSRLAKDERHVLERIEREQEAKKKMSHVNKQFLNLQCESNQERREEQDALKYKERQEIRRQEARRQHLLEKAKQQKLQELSRKGISERSQHLAHLK